jgi:hypothetical protein
MIRVVYRLLICLHPRAFRERFGDEMLSVFDEGGQPGGAAYVLDGCSSLARQWLLRSGLWRWAVGAGVTALLIVGYAHSEANWQRQQTIAQELADAKHARPLDKAEFNREAAQAVAILARFRKAEKKKSHPLRSTQATTSEASSQD